MRKPVILTGPRITPKETARLYGISERRTKELIDMVEKNLAKRSYSRLYYVSSSDNKNGNLKASTRGRATKTAKSNATPRSKSKRARGKASH